MRIKVFEKEYHGFESVYDLTRDVEEFWDEPTAKNIPGEFQGTLKITITYEGELNEKT